MKVKINKLNLVGSWNWNLGDNNNMNQNGNNI